MNPDLPIEIFLTLPNGIHIIDGLDRKTELLLLLKALYGLKESGRLWYELLKEELFKLGFNVTKYDPCIFEHKELGILLLVYVDDCLIGASSKAIAHDFVKKLNKKFEVTISDLNDFLGFKIHQTPNEIILSGKSYIVKTLNELGLANCKPVSTPVPTNYNLNINLEEKTHKPFKEYLGKLIWISNVRPDIIYAVHLLSTAAQNPTKSAWMILKRVFRYLNFGRNSQI